MTASECDKILKQIKEIERKWKKDLKKPHGGGLSDKLNTNLIILRKMYDNHCKDHGNKS